MLIEVSRFANVEEARAHAKQVVDEAAEAARIRFLTPGAGQSMEYQAAADEATAHQAGEPGPFPMLQADVDAGMADDIADAAALVLGTRGAWRTTGAAIRSVRLTAKREIEAATTPAAVAAIRSAAVAQLRSVGEGSSDLG